MKKPFVFGVPADDLHFIGREQEIKRLEANFQNGVNTILMSPRRWGKTSLINHVAEHMTNRELIIVRMDIFACRSEYDFYNTFSSEILRQTSSKIDEWKKLARGFIERLTPKISVSPDKMAEYTVSLGITPKTHTPEEVLSLPEVIAGRKGVHIVVCIDEFQQVGDFPDSLRIQKKMRSVWQHQKDVSYCLYGSKKHMMMSLFQKKSFPFYQFGDVQNLGLIPLSDWTPYIKDRFEIAGKSISDIDVEKICSTVEYQSSYVQQLAYSVYLHTDNTVTPGGIEASIEDLVSQNTGVFVEQVKSLTTYQINFLKAVNSGISTGFGESSIRDEYNLGSASNIPRLKEALINKELIELTMDGYVIGDPVLKMWLNKVLL